MTSGTELTLFTTEEANSWAAFGSLLEWLPFEIDQALQRDAGVNHFEFTVLSMLSAAPDGEMRMSDLAEMSNGSPSRLSHTAAKLERSELLSRRPDPENGRSTLATMTTTGVDFVARITPLYIAIVRRLVFHSLDTDGVRAVGTIGKQIMATMQPGHECSAPQHWSADQ